jgi:hypothetical protein
MPAPLKKKCPRCRKTKPAGDFYYRGRDKDLLSGYCRPCSRAYQKKRKQEIKDGLRLG